MVLAVLRNGFNRIVGRADAVEVRRELADEVIIVSGDNSELSKAIIYIGSISEPEMPAFCIPDKPVQEGDIIVAQGTRFMVKKVDDSITLGGERVTVCVLDIDRDDRDSDKTIT